MASNAIGRKHMKFIFAGFITLDVAALAVQLFMYSLYLKTQKQ